MHKIVHHQENIPVPTNELFILHKDMYKYNTRNKNVIHATYINNMKNESRKLGYRGRNQARIQGNFDWVLTYTSGKKFFEEHNGSKYMFLPLQGGSGGMLPQKNLKIYCISLAQIVFQSTSSSLNLQSKQWHNNKIFRQF